MEKTFFYEFGRVAFALALSPHKYIYKQMLSQHNIYLFSIHAISGQAKLHAAHIILELITEWAWKSTETPLLVLSFSSILKSIQLHSVCPQSHANTCH